MRIALFSKAFLPSVGGIETSSAMIARTWTAAGHDVEVVTAIPDPAPSSEPYRVTRTWTAGALMAAVRRADLVAVNGYSRLATAASVLQGHRIIVFHQGYQLICSDGLGFRGEQFHGFDRLEDLKLAFGASVRDGVRALARMPFDATVKRLPIGIQHVVPSHHVAARLGLSKYSVVYQPPNPSVIEAVAELGQQPPEERAHAYETGDIVFFGRLVFEKAADDLIRAYDRWRRERTNPHGRRTPRLIIHGRGPELDRLQALVSELGIAADVDLAPFVGGQELARAARRASVVVVPSRWEEPGATIGIELFACGVPVIASERGALGEVFKGHGRLFSNGDVAALTGAIRDHFSDGPIYPQPTGDEPWLIPAIKRELNELISPQGSVH